MLSARAGEESRIDGLEHGADDYIVKPFAARELVAKVADQSRARRARAGTCGDERHRLRELISQVPVAVNFLSADQTWSSSSPIRSRSRRLGGRQLQGRSVLEAFPEYRGQPFVEMLRRVYRTGEPVALNEACARLDRTNTGVTRRKLLEFDLPAGSQRRAESRGDDLRRRGHRAGARATAPSKSRRRRSDPARQAAEAANRAKDEFLAMLGHELRNPLSPISTAVQLMRIGR